MKVLLITGSYPPDVCGVAGYTEQLRYALEGVGANVSVFTGKRWHVSNVLTLDREIDTVAPDLVHIQYPASGYGWHLSPQVLSMLRPSVITIHECSQAHPLRQLALYPLSFRAPAVIFTNDFERTYAARFAPWIRSKSVVIPIGSNVASGDPDVLRLSNSVTYFGLIRPMKGLEDVLSFARLCAERNNGLRVRIVGTVLPGNERYFSALQQVAAGLPVEWILDLTGESLSRALAQTAVAYLPFPDGASERRGSLMAMLANGAAVVTTKGSHTPASMAGAVQFAATPEDTVRAVEKLFADPARLHALQTASRQHSGRYSWESIATRHLKLYQRLHSSR